MFEFFRDAGRLFGPLRRYLGNRDAISLARDLLEIYKERGSMIRLEIDSEHKTMSLEAQFQGEDQPFRIDVGRYEVAEQPGAPPAVRLREISTSKTWINAAMKAFRLGERDLPLPEQYAELIVLAL